MYYVFRSQSFAPGHRLYAYSRVHVLLHISLSIFFSAIVCWTCSLRLNISLMHTHTHTQMLTHTNTHAHPKTHHFPRCCAAVEFIVFHLLMSWFFYSSRSKCLRTREIIFLLCMRYSLVSVLMCPQKFENGFDVVIVSVFGWVLNYNIRFSFYLRSVELLDVGQMALPFIDACKYTLTRAYIWCSQ